MSQSFQPSPPPARSPIGWGHGLVFMILVALAVGAFSALAAFYRHQIDRYQYALPRYAAERALDALAAGELDDARREVALLQTERPVGVTEGVLFTRQFSNLEEGPVLRNRVQIYERLTAALLNAGLLEEADAQAAKTQLEFHTASRTLEMLIPWNLWFHVRAARKDWAGAWHCMAVLAAHGVRFIEPPGALNPIAFPVDPQRFEGVENVLPRTLNETLYNYFTASQPDDYLSVGQKLAGQAALLPDPGVRARVQALAQRALIQGGQRPLARQVLEQVWGRSAAIMDIFWRDFPRRQPQMDLLQRDPTLMEFLWNDRPDDSVATLAQFIDSFQGDARVTIDDLRGLEPFQTGYFAPDHQFMRLIDHVLLYQNIGVQLRFDSRLPVRRIYLGVGSTVALGVEAIVLMRVDEGAWMPLYCDTSPAGLLPVDVSLPPGEHTLQLIYLNDSGFAWPSRQIKEDRNVSLYRLALVHVQPRG